MLLEQVLLQNNTERTIGVEIRAKTTISQRIEHAIHCDMSVKLLKDWIPKLYLGYWSVFEKKSVDQLLEHKPWDHIIELKPGFDPKPC